MVKHEVRESKGDLRSEPRYNGSLQTTQQLNLSLVELTLFLSGPPLESILNSFIFTVDLVLLCLWGNNCYYYILQ